MALSYQTITDEAAYQQLAFSLISKVESLRKEAYLDTKNIPHIGYGFNLRDATLQPLVLEAFGLNPDDERIADDPLAIAREQYYKDALITAINMPWKKGEGVALRQLLDNLMAARAQDRLLTALGTSREPDFRFDSDSDPRIKGTSTGVVTVLTSVQRFVGQ